MRILLGLFKYFPTGGLQKDTLRFAEEAASRGHKVTILVTSWQGDKPSDGIDIRLCHCPGLSNQARMVRFADEFQRFRTMDDFDVSLAMNRLPGADFYFIADSCMALWMPKKHTAITLKCLPRYRTYLKQEADICAPDSRTTLLYIAPVQKNEYMKAYDMPEDRFAYLPPGMDPRCMRPADADDIRRKVRRQLGIGDDEKVIIQVGTNLWRKGIDRTFATVRSLADSGENVRMLLVGGDSTDDVRKLSVSCGIESRMLFLGPRNDVPQLLLASDLMVHPAREEGTGTVLIESIAAGTPVICTGVCGFANYAQESTQTALDEPFNQNSLDSCAAQCLRQLPQLAVQTIAFAKTQDFTGRSRVAIDLLEARYLRNKLDPMAQCSRYQSFTLPSDIIRFKDSEGEWTMLPVLTRGTVSDIIHLHQEQTERGTLLKNISKRRVSRVLYDGHTYIVKEFVRDHTLPMLNHARRTWNNSLALTGITPPCLAWLKTDTGRSFIVFADLGNDDLYHSSQLKRESLDDIYQDAGHILGMLHARNLYHADGKTTNYVINDQLNWSKRRVMMIDCDDIRRYRSLPMARRLRNIAQFLATMGYVPQSIAERLTNAFADGYCQSADVPRQLMDQWLKQALTLAKQTPAIENNLSKRTVDGVFPS